MASTLPHPHSADKPMFVPPQKRRTASGRTGTFTPSRSAPKSVIYGDQILNVQVWSVNLVSVAIKFMKMGKRKNDMTYSVINDFYAGTQKWFEYWEPWHWPRCAGLPGEAPHEHERHPGHHAQHPQQRQHPHPGAGQEGGEQPQHRLTLPDQLRTGQSQRIWRDISDESWSIEPVKQLGTHMQSDIWHTYTYHSLRVFAGLVINHLMCRAYPALCPVWAVSTE